jgi:hypothetical protein
MNKIIQNSLLVKDLIRERISSSLRWNDTSKVRFLAEIYKIDGFSEYVPINQEDT